MIKQEKGDLLFHISIFIAETTGANIAKFNKKFSLIVLNTVFYPIWKFSITAGAS
jgi:hypothetical protein